MALVSIGEHVFISMGVCLKFLGLARVQAPEERAGCIGFTHQVKHKGFSKYLLTQWMAGRLTPNSKNGVC